MAVPQDSVPGIKQEAESFRVRDPSIQRYQNEWTQYTPELTIILDLYRDLFETQHWPALEQHRSFRVPAQPRLIPQLLATVVDAFWTHPALRTLGEPTVILLPKTRNFIIDAKGPNPIILSTGRPPSVRHS